MKSLLFIFVFIIGVSVEGNAQFNYKEMVGFGCGFGGEQTESVQKISKLIAKEKYQVVSKLLDSDNNAERFLAIIVCEELSKRKKLALSKEQQDVILALYDSNRYVSVCSGCTYWDRLRFKEILEKNNHMRKSALYWFEKLYKSE